MQVQNRITSKLEEAFSPQHLEVLNESNKHNVPPGSESHFKLIVVCESFQGEMLIKRQRQINQLLADELANGVHALSMHTYTPAEWAEKNGLSPKSPPCLGGGK
ncbi:MAG: BolA/IbaG family iron-sulfur metabolism protein [Gammaproteobacteria bacterium]|jgi:BolA protein|nr:BolA/IbaG family iron-sulfur metabolism protein [Gammaproteobacteria bacterium]|tara:strand:- start:7367 stop:7678 length:312 start_codon:yes stop_codon:yes gene_type:complete